MEVNTINPGIKNNILNNSTMNTFIQNILVVVAVAFALLFLIRKFVWSPNKKSSKACGGDDGCGCH
jgi:hypothetical protein